MLCDLVDVRSLLVSTYLFPDIRNCCLLLRYCSTCMKLARAGVARRSGVEIFLFVVSLFLLYLHF